MAKLIQPLGIDQDKVIRFKGNRIVKFLLENGGFDMNELALRKFPAEDREEFAQLIGYSAAGFMSLSYVSPQARRAVARKIANLPAE